MSHESLFLFVIKRAKQSERFPECTQHNLSGFRVKFNTSRMLISVDFGGIFKMTDRVCCGFARVFIWETKAIALSHIIRGSDETKAHFNKRVLEERFHVYIEQFQDYKPLLMNKGKQTCSL